jgi:hypothetical protein
MGYFDTELNIAWIWFCTNWDKWINLNTDLSNELKNVMEKTTGPSGPHKEIYWQWVRENKQQLIHLYNSLKNN